MDLIRNVLTDFNDWLMWLPNPAVAAIILVVTAVIALALHRIVRRLLRAALVGRYPYAFSVLMQMRGLTQLAVLVVAMIIVLPALPLDPGIKTVFGRLLLIGVIGLIGWTAITALRIAADIYLLQFRLDVEDNLLARKHVTQVRVLLRTCDVLVVLFTIAAALMTFEPVRQYGVSLFASAGVAGIIAGLAARPVLSNLLAGIQLAMTQPIRIDDAVIVEGEWGTIEEITSTYVVVKCWDLRRLVVPLSYFIEKPFQNWTRQNSSLIGSALFYVDYRAPVGIIREQLQEIVKNSENWDGSVVKLQVTGAKEQTMELRAIMSAANAGAAFSLRCEVREKLIDFLQREHPEALPRQRSEVAVSDVPADDTEAEKRKTERAAAGGS
jgi:small-conductance mechanosensitive channel